MKKKVVAITASSFVLAALPVVGVFAADVTTATDTINVTVSPSCTLGVTEGKAVTGTVANGTTKEDLAGSTFSISCNDASGWHLTAVGAGTNKEDDVAALATAGGAQSISTSATISAETSSWGFKLAGTGVEKTYQSFAAVPKTATTVAKGTTTVAANEITTTYGVGISASQAAGTYSGKVTYVLAKGAGE